MDKHVDTAERLADLREKLFLVECYGKHGDLDGGAAVRCYSAMRAILETLKVSNCNVNELVVRVIMPPDSLEETMLKKLLKPNQIRQICGSRQTQIYWQSVSHKDPVDVSAEEFLMAGSRHQEHRPSEG